MVAFLFVSKIPVFWDFLFAQNAENKRWFVILGAYMKKISVFGISVGIAWLCIGTAGAIIGGDSSVVKCVKLNPSQTCTSSYSSYQYQIGWFASCGGTSISGIAACSSLRPAGVGDTRTSLSRSAANGNKYCWCKMIEPAISTYWVSPEVCTDSLCMDISAMTADEYACWTDSLIPALRKNRIFFKTPRECTAAEKEWLKVIENNVKPKFLEINKKAFEMGRQV